MKKILVAVDSFKGSMTSLEAGNAIRKGIKAAMPDCQVRVRPVADGGEGTTEALIYGREGISRETCHVTGPLGDEITAEYTIYDAPDGRTAVMEMAAASGLPLVPEDKRDPMHTTTYGVGEMIRDAIEKDCVRFIIGIGGSATNDGGIGMLQALGFHCLDTDGKDVPYGAEGLGVLDRIIRPGEMPTVDNASDQTGVSVPGMTDVNEIKFVSKLLHCTFRIACDVTNPLVGELGCSRVFAPQKGADEETVQIMDEYMGRYADVVENAVVPEMSGSASDMSSIGRYAPGAGAAGGLGYAFLMFLGGHLMPGTDIVLSETGLDADVQWADTVITGEGRIDSQTMMGKIPAGVAKLARRYGKYVIAIGGCLGADAEKCIRADIFNECYAVNDVLGIDTGDIDELRKSLERETAVSNLEKCTKKIMSLKKKLADRVCSPAKRL